MISISEIFAHDYEGKCDMCGVCCTHVSINSSLPTGEVFNKPAGVRCEYLLQNNSCSVWGNVDLQPNVCRSIKPMNSLCRFDLRHLPNGREDHVEYLNLLEKITTEV